MKTLRCNHCGLTLEPGLERCPRCLRKHTAEEVGDARRLDVVRWAFPLASWVLCVALWFLIGRSWMESERTQVSAGFFAATVVLLPPRLAFSVLLQRARWRDALGALGVVWTLAVLLAGAVDLTWRLTASLSAAVLMGLIFFAAPLVTALPLLEAWRSVTSLRAAAWLAIGRFTVVVAALVTLFGVRALTLQEPRPPSIVVDNPRSGVDPLDLAHAMSARAWRVDEAGLRQLHLASEAEPFERSLFKLKAELIDALSELDRTPDAAPVVTLWVPERFASEATRAAMAKESDSLNAVLTTSKRLTSRGAPVRVVIAFGQLPP